MPSAPRRLPPPWLFGITALPYGAYGGYLSTAMPYVLRGAGLPLDRIAGISALTLAPAIWYFLWAPVADFGIRRRAWLILMSALSAACLLAAVLQPLPARVDLFTALLVGGICLNMLVGASNGGLMATMVPEYQRGSAAGWYQAGNVGGGALGAGMTLWLAPHLSVMALASVVAAMVFLPSLAALAIDEPEKIAGTPGQSTGELLRELGTMFRSRTGLIGLAIFASPMGTAAAANLLSALAVDYHASEQTVVWITGFSGGLFCAAGSVVGGLICDRIPRRLAYALAAICSALCAAGLTLAPLSQPVFAIGASLYLAAQGFSFAAYSALSLELIGAGGRSATTRYTLYNAASNLPLVYMTWIDGRGYKQWGPRGLTGTDCLSNVISVAIFLLLIRRTLFVKAAEQAGAANGVAWGSADARIAET